MSDEEGNEIDGEEELAAPDWRVRAGPRNKPIQKARQEHEATRVPLRDWCTHCMMGRRRTHHQAVAEVKHVNPALVAETDEQGFGRTHQTKERGSVEKTHHCDGLVLHEQEVCCEISNNVRRISNLHRGERRPTSEHHELCCVEKRRPKNRGHLRGWREFIDLLVIVRPH